MKKLYLVALVATLLMSGCTNSIVPVDDSDAKGGWLLFTMLCLLYKILFFHSLKLFNCDFGCKYENIFLLLHRI